MTANKVYIIGIGQKPLDERCRQILRDAGSILASNRLMEVFPNYEDYEEVKDKVIVIPGVDDTVAYIREHLGHEIIALLASGDPLFYGIGRIVVAACGPEAVEIIPDLSSIQVAFARVKERWDNAFLISLHGGVQASHRYRLDDVAALLQEHRKVAALTDKTTHPGKIAKQLLASPLANDVMIHVCDRLGYPGEEKVTSGTPAEIAEQTFSDLNVVIMILKGEAPAEVLPVFGLRENEIDHSRGLITKDEVRAVSIHSLRLPRKGVLWDVGAGSGSVSIEAARLLPGLKVFAIEKEEEQIGHIETNKVRLGCPNITIVSGTAPDSLEGLPAPDRVFIGGNSGHLTAIIDIIKEKLDACGMVVINAVTLETLTDAVSLLEKAGFAVDVAQISVSRSKPLAGQTQLSTVTQVFVVKGSKDNPPPLKGRGKKRNKW